MAVEFVVELENKPGTLADLGETLGAAKVNIQALQLTLIGGTSVAHFVPDNPEKAAIALQNTNLVFSTRKVLIVKVLDEPGVLGDIARVLADAGINIETAYATAGGFLVLAVDDLDGAIQVSQGMDLIA